jgi:K+-transporting ATPase ATPase C chain
MKLIRPAIMLTVFFVVGFGLIFPFAITCIAQAVFPHQANGSLIMEANGQLIGSDLIGQDFSKPEYFHPRPSAAGSGYDAANSGGTNLGPNSDKLINGAHDPKNPYSDFDGVKDLAKKYREENDLAEDAVLPTDTVTRSASGLDPDISPENAELQAPRIAKARGLRVSEVEGLIKSNTSERWLGIYGEVRVNVLHLNLALDKRKSPSS